MKKWIFVFFFFLIGTAHAQKIQNTFQIKTGYNRIGFFNELGYKLDVKHHQFKLGLRHYTLDNFFEKNTVGLSVDYAYQFRSENDRYFFYPGISTAFFVENKTNARVFNYDYKLINGIGVNLNSNWALFYQIGFGVVSAKSKLMLNDEVVAVAYFNYELALGINYRFNN